MIELTRLNGNPLAVNSDLIKWAEAAPDTMLTLVNGEKIVVRESCAEVMERIHLCRARLLAEAARPGTTPINLAAAAAVDSALAFGRAEHASGYTAETADSMQWRDSEL